MPPYRYTFHKFLKDWMLVLGILAGAGSYLLYHALPCLHPAGPYLEKFCTGIQPVLLFSMLFLTFCRIEPKDLRPRKWQARLLLLQCTIFIALALILAFCSGLEHRVGLESLMLCIICPTATACAVVTGKLGGDMAGVVTYTILINIAVAILVPAFVPLIHPVDGLGFFQAFFSILAKVFPLLILPCLAAWLTRYLFPKLHARIIRHTDLSFYIWSVALTFAILMSTRALINSDESLNILIDIAAASLAACIFQFLAGRRIGAPYGQKITAGQALGQKNTVFGIWMGYTFLDPVTSIACGFYSIWHNLYNTWQLYRTRKNF